MAIPPHPFPQRALVIELLRARRFLIATAWQVAAATAKIREIARIAIAHIATDIAKPALTIQRPTVSMHIATRVQPAPQQRQPIDNATPRNRTITVR